MDTILIVDDDEIIIDIVEAAISQVGNYKTYRATNGLNGLKEYDNAASAVGINIIFLDLNMPGMDGIEFMRHLSERKYSGNLVLMSGEDKSILTSARSLAGAHHLNIFDVLEKPVSLERLKKVLDAIKNQPKEELKVATKPQKPRLTITEHDLRECLKLNHLTLFFQPKIDANTGELKSVESLVRWIDPEKGIIPPDSFISLAEKTGLIHMITYQVIEMAIKQAGLWHKQGYTFKVAFNVSVDDLQTLELPEFIVSQTQEAGIETNKIIVEVTESRLMSDLSKSIEVLTRLRLKGVELSIDDFGTGFSSLEQLERIPFNELKIDKAFVTDADKKPKSQAILESNIRLAKSLNMRTVAEGVETEAEFNLLKKLGIDLIQGYYFSKPLPAAELEAWITSRKSMT